MWMHPNLLSLLRLPLAVAFLFANPLVRLFIIGAAMVTDWLDGFFARKFQLKTPLGALLDPLMDKFFVIAVLAILLFDFPLEPWQVLALMSRDLSVLLYAGYIASKGLLGSYPLRAIWSGKITTVIQLGVLMAMTVGAFIPNEVFWVLLVLGVLALVELFVTNRSLPRVRVGGIR